MRTLVLRSVLVDGGATGVLRLVGMVCNFALGIVLARILGPTELGVYSFVVTIVIILNLPVEEGVTNLTTREIAKAEAVGNWPRARGAWRWSLGVSLGMTSLLVVATALAFSAYHNHIPALRPASAVWGIPLLFALMLTKLVEGALRGLHQPTISVISSFVIQPALLVGSVIVFELILQHSSTASLALVLHLASALISLGIAAFLLLIRSPRQLRANNEPREYDSGWFRAFVPLAGIGGVSVIAWYADAVLLGILTTPEQVGLYRIAVQCATLVGLAGAVMGLTISPQLARLVALEDMSQVRRLAGIGALLSTAAAIPIAVVFVLAGRPFLSAIFGESFEAAAVPLALLALGQLITAATGFAKLLLIANGYEKHVIVPVFIGAGINLVAAIVLIPRFGMTGAALATIAAVLFQEAWLCRLAWRKVGIDPTIVGALVMMVRRAA